MNSGDDEGGLSKNVNSELTAIQLKFAEVLANPQDARSQAEVAVDLGVRPETLSRWKRQNGFMEAVYELAKGHIGAELGKVLAALLRTATNGSVPAARLLLEATGKIKAGGIQNIISGQISLEKEVLGEALTDEQLRRIADALIERPAS